MAFNYTNMSFIRRNIIGFIGDAGSRPDSAKYEYGIVTPDVAATVEAAGYFDAATELNAGDCITAVMNAAVGQTPVKKSYIVTANNLATGGHIVIALGTSTAG